MKKRFLHRFFLAAVMGFIAGCVPAEFRFRELPEDPAAPITIAALLPLTGNNRIPAEQMKEGLLCAEERINNLNGINGRKLKLELINTAGSAEGTLDALEQAQKIGASGIIAGYDTQEVSMIIAHADKMRMPIVIPLATSNYHMEGSSFVYRNCFSDTQQMEVLANYLLHWRQLNRGVIVTDQHDDDDYTRGISRSFSMAAKDLNVNIIRDVTIQPEKELSREQLHSLLVAEPQFIMISARGRRAAQLIKTIRGAGYEGIFCGPDSWDDQEFMTALNGFNPGQCIFTAFFDKDNDSAEFKEFSREFRRRFFHKPGACETQSYDALIFLAIGLGNNADNLFDFDRNWRTIRRHHGAAALYTMLKKGGIDRTVYVKSLAVNKFSGTVNVYSRVTKKLQYSKLQDYRIIE